MQPPTLASPQPATSYTRIDETGTPYLQGSRCGACGTVFLGVREHCGRCCARRQMQPMRLASRGRLYSYTIVYRSYPGIRVPFVSAIVDLDGGGCVKGNLIDMIPNAEAIKFDMPVNVVFRDAGRKDKDGNAYLAYFFTPAS